MLGSLKRWVYSAFFALSITIGTWLWFSGRNHERDKRMRDRMKSIKKAKETRDEIETSDDQRIVDILTGKLRDDDR